MLTSPATKYFRLYYAGIYLGLALIFGSQYFTYRNVKDLSLNNERLNVTIGVLNQTANFGLVTKDFQSNMRGFLITENKDLLADNYNKKVQLVEISDTLFNLVKTNPVQTQRVQELLKISGDIVAYTQNIITIYRTVSADSAFSEIKKGEGIRLNSLLNNQIRQIEQHEHYNLNKRRQLVSTTQKNSEFFIFTTSGVGFLLTLFAIFFLNRDKRKQHLLQKELNEKERLLNQYLEAIPDGVMVVNQQKEIVLLNQSGMEILGIKSRKIETLEEEVQQLVLRDPTNYHVQFTAETLPVARGLAGEKLTGNKIDLIKANTIYHLESNVQPVVGIDGEITSAITVFRDITERANYEATLEKARILAEKSVRVKDIFLSNVSHEIRTPLNAITGFTNLLVSELTDPKSLEFLGYIQYANKNLLELINDILDFSKIEAGQVHLEKGSASIRDLIKSISAIMRQRAGEKGISYEAILADNVPEFIETDKLRLTQILLNVCGNAIKFTETGSVKLRVTPVSDLVNGVQTIWFQVEDTGIGIEKDKLASVFNRFVQATESTTRIFGGTGLGLSIVKSLVELFDGKLTLQSEVGKGSVFTIEIPLRIAEHAAPETEIENVDDISKTVSSLHILAAEDNLLNQKLLSAIFERMKIPLTIVNNGLEAIQRLEKGGFDIVLMDIQMPVMDGYTAIKQIRQSISKTIPIITMTAHAMIGEKEECLSIGANSYISKPFKESELLYTIAQLGNKENNKKTAPAHDQPLTNNTMTNSILNLEYLAEITGGDRELRDELISMFENDSKIQLTAIREASKTRDLEQMRQAIHKFRSSLFSVGLLTTANQYKDYEAKLKQGIWDEEDNRKLLQLEADSTQGLVELKML
ncbi:ATP-binding protein [Dyadobacter alkalitolerans]|uniref:ATP-binding protein n=1 Tax=Dyadobacter alkalitolerans TaxID=492736 RepID=UPI000409444C|nr:ATP-binding protein [Dyadobacter alkalitolerans]